jgi:DNA glycosylase AlkZ-like
MTTSLTWPQVHAWRLAQHGLSPRLAAQNLVETVTRAAGIQAQVMSAAELAICSRVETRRPEDVRSALWQERTLVKTWAMRGTLHLLAANDLPLFVAARNSCADLRGWRDYFTYYGFSAEQHDRYLAAIPHVLTHGPLTRQQLAEAVAKETGVSGFRDLILSSGWGSPLKLSAYRGDLCFGPSQGQSVTFAHPGAWLGAEYAQRTRQAIEPEAALQAIARRYLQDYGPATAQDFARWWQPGGGVTPARRLFQSLDEELVEVEVEGWRAFALRASLEPMRRMVNSEAVRLLPLFDAYTIGAPRDCESLLAAAHKSLVFRAQGWVSAVVVAHGSIQGVWRHKAQRSRLVISVQLFRSPTATIRKGIAAEVERLGATLQTSPILELSVA